jgi:hypothetical protein
VEHTFRKPLFGSALTDSKNIPFSHFSFERKDSSFKIVKKVTWYNFFFLQPSKKRHLCIVIKSQNVIFDSEKIFVKKIHSYKLIEKS